MASKTNSTKFLIKGMHCRSCEILVEDSLANIPGIKRSEVDYKKGEVEIYYEEEKPSNQAIEHAIKRAGYSMGYSVDNNTLLSKNPEDYKNLGIAAVFFVGIYVILKNFGFFDFNVGGNANPSSLFVVFLIGITAGLSTCMALVGGLILGISAGHAEKHPTASPAQKFRPHLFFNAGRVSAYIALGGALGIFGSFLQFSSLSLGILTIIVGIVMLLLGLKLTGIFPRLENGGLLLPKRISRMLGIGSHQREYSHRNSFILGALTFFLPCGFTQAMQLYAVSSGSFMRGALIMGIFALGTAPGLLSIGGFTSAVKGIFAQRFFKFAGIVVVLLAFFNINNGFNLTGWQIPVIAKQKSAIEKQPVASAGGSLSDNIKMENGVQVVRMIENSRGYSPNKFTVRKGVPVKWIIDAQDPYSCASSLVLSKLGIKKNLKSGENVVELTFKESGKFQFSCSMGMYTGVFDVVD